MTTEISQESASSAEESWPEEASKIREEPVVAPSSVWSGDSPWVPPPGLGLEEDAVGRLGTEFSSWMVSPTDVPELSAHESLADALIRSYASDLDLDEDEGEEENARLRRRVRDIGPALSICRQLTEEVGRGEVLAFLSEVLEDGSDGEGGSGSAGGSEQDEGDQDSGGSVSPSTPGIETEHDSRLETLSRLLPSLRHGPDGQMSTLDLQKLEEVCRKFENDPYWKKILSLIGRLSSSAWAPPARTSSPARDDVVDTEMGADPSKVFLSELARLAVPQIAAAAWVDLIQKRMLQICVEGTEPMGNGPIYVAIDVSTSMEDPSGFSFGGRGMSRIEVAAILLMSLIRIADVQKRKVKFLAFNTFVTWEKSVSSPSEAVRALHFLMSGIPCGGGTDFDRPLCHLSNWVEQGGGRLGADLVFLTDGEASVSQATRDRMRVARKTGARLFSLLIGPVTQHSLEELSMVSDIELRLASWNDLEAVADAIAEKRGV